MIVEDELFQNTNETGYRFCISNNKDTFGRIFSAHWDPNNSDRMYLCLQDGRMKSLKIETNESKIYKILFRRFRTGSLADVEPSREINTHFDKICFIPGRPGEFVFLLGVSKTLMYSALPGTGQGLAATSSDHAPDFAYGCPVLELIPHSSRITAVDVSYNGNFLATGDELGNMKVMLLQHFEDLEVLRHRAKPGEPLVPANSLISFKPHGAPIFTIKFLPGTHCETMVDSRNAGLMKYGLSEEEAMRTGADDPDAKKMYRIVMATGSIDRAVRLWQLSYSSEKGLSVVPFMSLNTMSTNLLCLNAAICGMDPPSQLAPLLGLVTNNDGTMSETTTELSDRAGSSLRTAHGQDDYRSSRGMALKGHHEVGVHTNDLPSKSTIILAGGTNQGAIYVWKLDTSKFKNRWSSSTNNNKDVALDDGTLLLSLLHASDKPIVQLALGAAFDVDSHKERIVLAASDTSGTIKVHAEVDSTTVDCFTMSENANTTESSSNEKTETETAKDAGSSGGNSGNGSDIQPLSIVGEAHFTSPIVACSFPAVFHSQYEWKLRDAPPQLASMDSMITAAIAGMSDEATITTTSTEDIDEDVQEKAIMSLTTANEKVMQMRERMLDDVKEEVNSKENMKRLLVATADGELRHYRAISLLNLVANTTEAEEAAIAAKLAQPDDEDDDSTVATGTGSHHSGNQSQSSGSGSRTKNSINVSNIMSPHSVGTSTSQGRSFEVIGENMSVTLSLADSASGSVTDSKPTTGFINSTSSSPVTPSTRSSPSPLTSTHKSKSKEGVIGMIGTQRRTDASVTFASDIDNAAVEEEDVDVESDHGLEPRAHPLPTPSTPPSTFNLGHMPDHVSVSTADTSSSPLGKLAADAASKIFNKTVVVDNVDEDPDIKEIEGKNQEKEMAPSTPFAAPVLNASRAVEGRIAVLKQMLANDDVSVASIESTESERRRAANASMNDNRNTVYEGLIKVDEDAIEASKPRLPKVRTQIDDRWKSLKNITAPSEEDLSILHTSHPYSRLTLSDATAGANITAAIDKGQEPPDVAALAMDFSSVWGAEFKLVVPSQQIYGAAASIASDTSGHALWQRINRKQNLNVMSGF